MWLVLFLFRPLFYSNFSSTLKHQMPPRCDPGFNFPPELTQPIQQQNALMQMLIQNQNNNNNNPPPPPLVDNLTRMTSRYQDTYGDKPVFHSRN